MGIRWSSSTPTTKEPFPLPKGRKVAVPKIPPRPTSPFVYVTEEEYQTYVKPLFWYRWTLIFANQNIYLKDGELHSGVFCSPYLRRVFYFNGMEETKSFVRDMNEIIASEKHEPFMTIRPYDRSPGLYQVSLLSSTHQCHNAPSLVLKEGTRVGPGISLLDARLANLAERHFQEEYLKPGHSFEHSWKHFNIPLNVEKIKERHLNADERLMKRELSSYDPITTPDLGGVTPMPVPDVPLRVDDEPCTDEDFAQVISPLYTRGWCIVYNNIARESDGNKVVLEKYPVLSGFFKFKSYDTAMRFSQDVMDLARAEDISVGIWSEIQTVTVQGTSREQPSMMMKRDVRFAALVERLFVDKYENQARRSTVTAFKLFIRPKSVVEMMTHPARLINERRYRSKKWDKIVRAKQRDVDRKRGANRETGG